jgi:hypothetical protein
LFGKESAFGWHENLILRTTTISSPTGRSPIASSPGILVCPRSKAIPVESEIKSFDELVVGLPKDNLTILGLAQALAGRVARQPVASSDGAVLRKTLRYQDAGLYHAWALGNTKNKGLETRSYRFDFSNGLSADAVWLKAVATPGDAPATLVLHDQGKKTASDEVADRVNRGEQVLAVDLLFTGSSSPQNPDASAYTQMLAAVGDRPLGLEAAQLITIVDWLRTTSGSGKVRLGEHPASAKPDGAGGSGAEPGMFLKL